LDLCSAPGGKTTLISELLDGTGTLIAGDIHPHKLKLVNDNLRRLELKDVTVKLMDATVFEESLRNRFDKILLDAPCTGYGVMRKKPDMKYKKSTTEIQSLVEIQRKMITNASKYLKKGGILLYSTCTISEDENENMIKWAVEGNNGLKLESLKGILPNEVVGEDGMVRLYPNVHGTDGFFIARMKK